MASAAAALIRFDGVSKHFGSRAALAAVSFQVEPGEVVALLGPNGAGKSTAFGVMLGHVRPSGGTVYVHGRSVQRERRGALRGLGAVPEAPAFYEYLTGGENLRCLASYAGGADGGALADAVRFVGLGGRIDDPVRTYSRGMRQRLAIAQALVPTPDVVVLDEPAEGLDPEGIADVHALVARMRRERGLGVLMASHLLPEIEQVADRALVLVDGVIVFAGACRTDAPAARHRLALDDWTRAAGVLAAAGVTHDGDEVDVGAGDVADVVALLVRAGISVRRVEPARDTLRDRYLRRGRPRDGAA